MIDVGVRKNDDVDGFGIKARKAAVDLVSIFAMTLIKSTIEKNAFAIDFKQMLRAGSGSSCATKFEFHRLILPLKKAAAMKISPRGPIGLISFSRETSEKPTSHVRWQ